MPVPAVIAVDLGGTLLRTGVVTGRGEIVHQVTERVGDRRGAAAIEAFLREAVAAVYAWAREHGIAPGGVALAVPGLVDGARGILRYAVNLDVRDFPVRAIVREAVPLPVVVENDVRAAAWGEWRWGAGRGSRSAVLMSAGTGIAAAAVIGGRLYRGASWAAGEIGHVPFVADGERCRCGHLGCLETVAGGWGIARRAETLAAAEGSPLPGVARGERVSTEVVFQAARAGHRIAQRVVSDAASFMGRAAVALARVWNPDRLILSGGLFFQGSPLVEGVERAIQGSALYGDRPPAVLLAEFGGNSGLIGAACLLLAPEEAPAAAY